MDLQAFTQSIDEAIRDFEAFERNHPFDDGEEMENGRKLARELRQEHMKLIRIEQAMQALNRLLDGPYVPGYKPDAA